MLYGCKDCGWQVDINTKNKSVEYVDEGGRVQFETTSADIKRISRELSKGFECNCGKNFTRLDRGAK